MFSNVLAYRKVRVNLWQNSFMRSTRVEKFQSKLTRSFCELDRFCSMGKNTL
jgi:hypothetical protein